MSALTLTVAIVALAELGVLAWIQSETALQQVVGWVLTVVGTVVAAALPLIVVEEYKLRRQRGRRTLGGQL
jgi:hypothetical protein